jgi:hypothetical protein
MVGPASPILTARMGLRKITNCNGSVFFTKGLMNCNYAAIATKPIQPGLGSVFIVLHNIVSYISPLRKTPAKHWIEKVAAMHSLILLPQDVQRWYSS